MICGLLTNFACPSKVFCEFCELVFNNNEIGKAEDPNLIFEIKRIHNEGDEKSYKALGVLLDEYLSFDDHISHLCVKISKSLFCINRLKTL